MATINDQGNIQACCPECHGALSTFEWMSKDKVHGAVLVPGADEQLVYRLYRCAGCGNGAMAVIKYAGKAWPGDSREIVSFHSESKERLRLPALLPQSLLHEFREAETCMDAGCLRAATGLFRSVLAKLLRTNGYAVDRSLPLARYLDAAATDGIITQARQKKAQRVLGPCVIEDEWHEPPRADVENLRRYAQQLLEDFYEDRPAVVLMLREAGRLIEENKRVPGPVAIPGRRFIPTTLQ